jgi:D-3-phosphoglycerate dehydrogenase / 2-oxoglutarate reductase
MTANIKRLGYFESFMDPVALSILGERPDIELVRLEFTAPVPDTDAALCRCHGYQISPRTELREPFFGDAALLARCPDLLAISSTGAGYDMVDVDACTSAGVIVVNQSGTNKEGVAEHALGLMLSLSKKIALSGQAMRRTHDLERRRYVGNDIRGKTVGIIGIGHIGTRVAELCRGLFDMTVLAYDPYLTTQQIAARGAEKVELGELLRRSDFVSVHCPRSAETFGMIGRNELAQMQPHAYFINTARGGIHDEAALAEALTEGRVAGAGLDVFLQEPPALDHPLLALDNVVISPHIAGMTVESMHEMVVATAQQWIAIFAGAVPPRLVNPAAWPRYSQRFADVLGFRPAELE